MSTSYSAGSPAVTSPMPVGEPGSTANGPDSGTRWPTSFATYDPATSLLENVSDLLVRGLDRVLASLAEIGYDAEWDCVPAAAIGAAHVRDRWFAVAYPLGHTDRDRRHLGAGQGRVFHRRPEPAHAAWWAVEPDVGRVAYGVPGRVDRCRGLGNAVVPQVAEHVGRLLVEFDRRAA
jgi:DNA (cytosine-5)-methyltransferase 1